MLNIPAPALSLCMQLHSQIRVLPTQCDFKCKHERLKGQCCQVSLILAGLSYFERFSAFSYFLASLNLICECSHF